MSLVDRLASGALRIRADVSGTPAPWDDYWYNPLGNASASGMRITETTALRVAAVLACVGIIGRTMGMMPMKIYTESPDGSKRTVDQHPLYDVLYARPNAQQTAFEFKQMMQGHLELRGNAYAKIVPGSRGAVDQLVPMHPDLVHVERAKPSGRLIYVYDDPLTARTERLTQEEVFHLRNFSSDGVTGQSTIGMACDVFGLALAQQDYACRFTKNDARPPIALEAPGLKTKPDRDNLRESWQEGQSGANRGKAAILPPGVTIKELGVKPIDQQLLDARKFSRIEIASLFPVPPHKIGETEKTATYASVEQMNINYVVDCILPRSVLWEQAVQRDLITSSRYFPKFSLASLLRGDTAARFAAYHQAIGDGWLSPDDVRALEDLNPIPGGAGRRYWRPVNWAPLDQDSTPRAAPPSPPPDGDSDDSENFPGDDAAALRAQLMVLATGAAERCVRREVNGLRKLVERGASGYQIEEFYAEQLRFATQALNPTQERQTELRQDYYGRSERIAGHLAANDKGAALEYLDQLGAQEPLRLARMITGAKP